MCGCLSVHRLRQVHERIVQFVLAAATIPTSGTLSVDRYISRRFPMVRLHEYPPPLYLPVCPVSVVSNDLTFLCVNSCSG